MNTIRYKITMTSKLTGLSPELLRTWELRYDFLKPERGPGGQRLYSPDDLDLLFHIKELLSQGHSISELNQWGKQRLLRQALPLGGSDKPFQSVPENTTMQSMTEILSGLINSIVEGAVACNQEQILNTLNRAMAIFSPQIVLHDILRRSAIEIGNLWRKGECSVAGEHLVSALFTRRIEAYLSTPRDPFTLSRPKILCTCIPDEQHILPCQLVACHLFDLGYTVIPIHGGMPFSSIESAIRSTQCQRISFSVSSSGLLASHRASLLDFARRLPEDKLILLGGSGVEPDEELTAIGIRLCPHGQPITNCSSLLIENERQMRQSFHATPPLQPSSPHQAPLI